MDEQQFHQYVEKKLAMKQQAYHVISQTGAVRREWKCDECGAVLQWDSEYARYKHRKSRKHTLKNQLKI